MKESSPAEELRLAREEIAFLIAEREKREAELVLANIEREFEIKEKEKRAAELLIAVKELTFQNEEKEKRATELDIANKELIYQNKEKENRAAELAIANTALRYESEEKQKRAAELLIANKVLLYESGEKSKRAAELLTINAEIALHSQLQELNKKKDDFIALASHELKTPLTSITAYLQFIQRNLVTEDRNKHLTDKALLQVYKLTALVSDLLDVSKIESGQLSMSFQEFNIVELLNDVIDVMHYGNLNHKIIKNCSASEIIVYADKQRIEQVMINLVSNAIKYSPDGDRVIVSVHDHEGSVLVSIQDFGIGINAEDQPQIFSRFYRVEELASFIAGLGIGLYISQDIMERHGSVITVDSHYGVGSTFSFKLPAQRGLS